MTRSPGICHIHSHPSNKIVSYQIIFNEKEQWDKQAVISMFYLFKAMTLMKVMSYSLFIVHAQHIY